ncbi:glycoside hydrolase family 97 N-terminal domain-containing protein [Flavivirga amylovorans]|uniref:Glycoside hydrolase family 97 N-terminal domain-containing protein n=1 Tax=Flavivirga amylovorans TaxID=870486 RepID=A0ABT8WY49_9FLAO|nr:glycoside hydrolase family 97 protein [Flavivirga amylovorans]MDO5986578.1 glycoside hydrolase family 97 N-terminal domain-containing protein [Flavivirga amylovorans]
MYKNKMIIVKICLLSVFFSACSKEKKTDNTLIKSPNLDFEFVLKTNDSLSGISYSVSYKNEEIIGDSKLGFVLNTESLKNKPYQIANVSQIENSTVDSTWLPVYGERNKYPEIYNESLFRLSDVDNQEIFNLRVRAYNEGIAFRYEFTNEARKINIIQKEITEFSLPPKAVAWASLRAQSEILKMPVSSIKEAVERPLLVELQDSLFLAIGEAALVDYARMKFINKEGSPGTLVSELSSEVIVDLPLNTPWRFIMAAEKPGQLLEHNYLLLNLNEPNQLEDTSWIKPGKVIRETTLTTKGGIACVDFAEKHNLQFIEFDAGWYGNEYDEASDATTITVDPKRSKGPLDLLEVIKYAKSKNIGVILYVNRRALEKQLDDVLPLLSSWGVSGIKYGFVNVGPQKWTSWLHDAVRKAADYKLMIDTHDEYRPTGYSRTYPNFMTQEGIRGDEESPENSMVINTIFTRMIAGAGDQTNCYFAPRVTETMGSHVSQLAKAVCIYSPWQFLYWYDRPEGSVAGAEGAGGTKEFIKEVPELAFYDALPTVWDDTKVIDGYPGEFAVIARRSGNDWFIGALNGDIPRDIKIPLDFLTEGKTYEATIYFDDDTLTSLTKVGIDTKKVSIKDNLAFKVKNKNGVAIHLKAL